MKMLRSFLAVFLLCSPALAADASVAGKKEHGGYPARYMLLESSSRNSQSLSTPVAAYVNDEGAEVALITDGRFSGATHGACIGHISPEAAEFQAARVAAARKLPLEKVRRLVAEHLIPGGILGENVINVMTLNAALDTLPPS